MGIWGLKMNDKFDISKFENIIKIFPVEWFENENNKEHVLFKINKRLKDNLTKRVKENLEYLESANKLLGILKRENLISKDIKTKLKNPPQFEDTLSEIKVASHLISNKIKKLKLGKSFPDIELTDQNVIIEVKNLHSAQKWLDSNGEVVCLDDIGRMRSKVEEILPKLEGSKVNIILFDVTGAGVSFEEFKDLCIYSEKITINLQTKEVVPLFKGEFSKEENKNISAVVMLKDMLKDWYFKGLINPLSDKTIPDNIKKLFNLIDVEEYIG